MPIKVWPDTKEAAYCVTQKLLPTLCLPESITNSPSCIQFLSTHLGSGNAVLRKDSSVRGISSSGTVIVSKNSCRDKSGTTSGHLYLCPPYLIYIMEDTGQKG